MTEEQEQALTEKLTEMGYPDFEAMPGEEEILMLYIDSCLICGVEHALSLSDEALNVLIEETVAA